jgi:hypothetical protein
MDDTKIDMDDVETLKALVATYREWMDEREKEIVSLRRQASTALAVMRGERDRLENQLAEIRASVGARAAETANDAVKRLVAQSRTAETAERSTDKVVDDVRTELGAKTGELTIDAVRRVVAERDAAQRWTADVRRERDGLKDQRVDLRNALGVQPREDILDVAKLLVRERDGLKDERVELRGALGAQADDGLLDVAKRVVRERDEVRESLKRDREHANASDKTLLETHRALGGSAGVEHVTEAAKRVVAERDEARRERDILKDEHAELRGTLGVQLREDILDVAKRVVAERDEARAALDEFSEWSALKREIESLTRQLDAVRVERDQALLEASRLACTSGPPVIVGQIEHLTSQLEDARVTIASMKDERKKLIEALDADEGADLVLVAKYVMRERDEERKRHLETGNTLNKVIRERESLTSQLEDARVTIASMKDERKKLIEALDRAISQTHQLTQSLLKLKKALPLTAPSGGAR